MEEVTPFFKIIETPGDSTDLQELVDSVSNEQRIITDLSGLDSLLSVQRESEADTGEAFGIFSAENWQTFKRLKDNRDLSDQQILDSLDTEDLDSMEILFAKQLIRVNRSESDSVASYIYKNMPIMMFFLLPVFAMILNILYIRRRNLYIEHLIHALHIHSFTYFIFGLTMIPMFFIADSNIISPLLAFIAIITVTVYVFKSFRRVYGQGWFKTFVKFILIGPVYGTVLLLALALEVAISLIFY